MHGGQQTWGQDYWDTYAPVVTWASDQLLLIVVKIRKLDWKSIDFVLAFPQADLDVPVYMELLAGILPTDDVDLNWRKYVLRLNKSMYGLKQRQVIIGLKNSEHVCKLEASSKVR